MDQTKLESREDLFNCIVNTAHMYMTTFDTNIVDGTPNYYHANHYIGMQLLDLADAVGTDEERRGLFNMVPTSTMSSDESRQRLKQFIARMHPASSPAGICEKYHI